jgi:hypothetical protein
MHFSEASFYRYGGMTKLHPPSSRIVQVQRSVCITTASWFFTILSADYPQVTMSLGATEPFARLEATLSHINHGDSAAVVALEQIGGHFFVIQRRSSDGFYKLYQSWVDYFEPTDWESDQQYTEADIPHFLYQSTNQVAITHLTDLNKGKKAHSSALWFPSGPFIEALDGLFNFIATSPTRPIPPEREDYQRYLAGWKNIFGLDIANVAKTNAAIEPKAQLTAWTEKSCQANYDSLVAELEKRHAGYTGPEAGADEAAYIPSGAAEMGSSSDSLGDAAPPTKPKLKKRSSRKKSKKAT